MLQKMKRAAMLGLTLSVLAFTACSDDETPIAASPENAYDAGDEVDKSLVNYRKPTASITLKVDSKTSPYGLDSVKVVLVTAQDSLATTYSDSLGEVIYENLPMGSYDFLIQKTGYAPIYKTVELINESVMAEVPKVPDVTASVELLELSVSAKGKVVYTDADGNSFPAKGAALQIVLNSGSANVHFVEDVLTATTDSLGDYTLTNIIPENTEATVYAKSITVDGQVYKATGSVTVPATFSGELEYLSTIKMSTSAAEFIIYSTNLKEIAYNQSIQIVFSEDIDTSMIKLNDIEVFRGGSEILTTYSVSADLRTLSITPEEGNWGTTGSFSVELSLFSTGNEYLDETLDFSFEVTGVVGTVAGLTVINTATNPDTNVVNSSTDMFYLSWNPLANVVGYQIFKKESGDSNYTYLQTEYDTLASIDSDGWFTAGKTVSLKVIGYNSEEYSAVATSTPVVLTDKLGPSVTGATDDNFATINNFDNSGETTTLQVGTADVYFDEEVSETTVITITSPNPAVTSYTWTWISPTRALVTAYVLPDVDASNTDETAIIDISTVVDLLGNAVVASDATISIDLVD